MANWDKNKTISTWCAGEIFIFLTPWMFCLMLNPQLNWMRRYFPRGGKARVMPRWTQGAPAKYYRSDQSDPRAAKAHDKRWPLCFKAHILMHTNTYNATSFPYRQSVHPSVQSAMRPAENKFSFPLGEQGLGITWSTRAVGHHLPDQRTELARGSSLTEAIIKTEVMF